MSVYCMRKLEQLEKHAHPEFKVKDVTWSDFYCTFDINNTKLKKKIRAWAPKSYPVTGGSVTFNVPGELHDSEDWVEGDIAYYDSEAAMKRIKSCGAEVTDVHTWEAGRGTPYVYDHVHFEGPQKTERCLIRKLLEEP